ncbi:MAG: Ig-like domain-containing protein [Taibaiella sp.]|nr:Ig-like domain-containing protein [Taibaiella sp.]
MYRRLLTVLWLVCCVVSTAVANVSVTAASGGTNICSNKAATGSAPAFTTLNPISITEVLNSDFSTGTATIVLNAPSGWQFSSTMPGLSYVTGSNITGISGTISSTALTINVTVAATTGADQVTITGLQVQATTTSSSSGNILASVASGVAGIGTGASGTNFGSLSLISPATASVSISATPSGSVCTGTNVTFVPSPTSGGTPQYTWSLNGTDVFIGATYSNASLASGNTVTCRMLSSLGCLVSNPVYANTITMTVLSVPAAVTGSATVCPTTTTTLSTTATGGTWSSSNTAVGTVNSSGVVTGIAAGTARISYNLAGCASTKTLYVNNPPFAPALTPSVTTICNNTGLTIYAAGNAASGTILSQDFNSGLGSWTVDTFGSTGIVPGAEWKACADSYMNEQGWYRSPDYSTFVMANADTSGSSTTLSTRLTSPTFSLADYASANLSFQHAYEYWPSGDVFVNLEISTNGGSTWTTITNFKGASVGNKMSFQAHSVSLNAYLGNANVKIRFYYKSTFGYYWAIDNIIISGTPGRVTPTWSPVTHLFADAAHTTAYTAGTPADTVYMYPTTVTSAVTMVYTVTAAAGACVSSSTATVTVNPEPGATTGSLNLCPGTTTTLSNSGTGGTWVSGNTSIATVGSATGIVSGVAAGTAAISYVVGSSCATVVIVTVHTAPAAIDGNLNVCIGYPRTLTSATTGGTWSSSSTFVATVGGTTGIVSGMSYGTARITYSLGGSCVATAVVTVQPLPSSITGPTVVCASQSITLADATSGGTWVSGNSSIATVGSTSGTVTGVAGGVAPISYVLTTTGCFSIRNVTVNPIGPITGGPNACLGYTLALSNTATGGTWVSGNTSVATIDGSTGLLSPVAIGTTNITYTLSTGCVAYATITVNALPADITGVSSVCVGGSTTLACSTSGGTWSSSNATTASVGSSSGSVSGGSAGSVTISYTAATGCFKTFDMTVNPVPAAITGTASLCEGLTTSLSCATSGGAWSSSNTSVATVTGGTVTGVASGTATITYTLATGCYGTRSVTVNPLPGAITGTLSMCQGVTTTLSSATSGGTWTSSNTIVASITSPGNILGGTSGTATISYTLSTGCRATAVVTVNAIPAGITGSTSVCTGQSTTLTNTLSGGTWASSNTSIATIGTGGDVTGVTAGLVTITYSLSTGCSATRAMTVNQTPSVPTGTTSVCKDLTTTLSASPALGTWASSNSSVATVAAGTGVVTGVNAGSAIITYLLSTGCLNVQTVTVLPLPSSVSGDLSICLGNTSTLTNSTSGGSWSSSNTSVVSIGSSSGIAFGATTGSATISYVLPTGCYKTALAVVNPLPSATVGADSVCQASTTLFINPTGGGTWTSANTAVATIGSSTGVISGISGGTSMISYVLPTGCPATKVITVNPLPATISGPDNICQSSSAAMSNTSTGGTWSSGTVTVATIGSASGTVFGVIGGATIITYTLPTGCLTIKTLTVTSLPAAISGANSVCVGSATPYTDMTTGGTWSSGNPSVATINSSGLVTGIAEGTAQITYTLPLGCIATKLITVNPLPADISGSTSLCLSSPQALTNATGGGTWSSSSTITANVTSGGIVTGTVYGTANISYTLPTGCYKLVTVTVNMTPSAISGSTTVCEGSVTPFTNTISGGTWSTSNSGVATVSSTGAVSGIAAGNATITYTLSTGCFATKSITVNPLPGAITGPAATCQGLTVSLASSTTGGTWSSSNLFVATAGTTTGLISGSAAGTANITYTLPTGCLVSRTFTVYALPGAITGAANACVGGTTLLSTSTGGGTWNISGSSAATIDAGGLVTGIVPGTATVTYTLGVGCFTNRVVTVNPLPPAITGNIPTCVGMTITLGNPTPGGTWTSTTAPGVATVGASTGVVTPVSPGTATITYTLPTGCYTTEVVLVNTVQPITGNTALCAGTLSILTHAVSGGTWSSSTPTIAGIAATTGMLVAYTAGTSTISYALPGGCYATKVATVTALPAAISGPPSVCPGFSITLSNSTSGGSWSSTNTAVAAVGTGGVVTGIVPGTTIISYSTSSGCSVTKPITVNALPAAISGTMGICSGATSTFTTAVTGGTWSTSNASVITIGATSGVATGGVPGTATISYTPASGCIAVAQVTVNPLPAPITGGNSLCAGATLPLANTVTGGTWSSTNTAIATIDGTGLVSGVTPGTTLISYTSGIGCATTSVITVNTMPTPITGVASACAGYSTALSSTPSGGTWSTGNASIATVGSTTGLVTGIAAGTANITYGFTTGCRVSVVVTVSAAASSVTGPGRVCEASSITLTDPAMSGGAWSSGDLGVATVDGTSGVVTGVAAGTASIYYTIGIGCNTVKVVTVDGLPAPIAGMPSTCIGLTTSLISSPSGGTWTSSNVTIGNVNATTGVVTGVTAGTVNISYTLGTGCRRIQPVSVNVNPGVTSGVATVCAGSATNFTNAVPGGVWASGNIAVATVGTDGTVTGVSAGTAVISYLMGPGCQSVRTVTVYAVPAPIYGASSICNGATTTLSTVTTIGTWSSSVGAVATVDAATGLVSSLSAGTTIISFTSPEGCSATKNFTVSPHEPNTGIANTCVGFYTTIANLVPGGTWASSNTAVANVGMGGAVTGLAAGTTTIIYTTADGCQSSTVVTVATVTPVTGPGNVCAGQSITLSNAVSGGTWTSGNSLIATVGSGTGLVTGLAAGFAMISYNYGGGCAALKLVTVSPLSTIAGPATLCNGQSVTLTNATSGGTWSTSDATVATVSATGLVSGITTGTATISYMLGTGCVETKTVTVNPISAIVAPSNICAGTTVSFSNATPGGTWTSSSSSVALVGVASGNVTGMSAGSATITYTVPTGCQATLSISVDPAPASFTGSPGVCLSATTTLSTTSVGGTWSSSDITVAPIDAAGMVTGSNAGTSIVSYTLPTGCYRTIVVTVNALPPAITGTPKVCVAGVRALSNAISGGTWSSSSTGVATVGSSSGIVSGLVPGTSVITYTPGSGCFTSVVVTVSPEPPGIIGATQLCAGGVTTLSNAVGGGTWSSTGTIVSVGSSTGVVSGITTGTSVVTYSLATGCSKYATVTVNPLPSLIVGPTQVCLGGSVYVLNTTGGGTWSSSDPAFATVGPTGMVSGIAVGTATLTYTLPTGCYRTAAITVEPLPAAIAGPATVCIGQSTTLSSSTAGGSWASSSPTIASVSAAGVVSGAMAGIANIIYTLPTGCSVQSAVTVSTLPAPLSLAGTVCVGQSVTGAASPVGGLWSSSATSVATADPSTGLLIGVSAGTATISYTLATGCFRTATLTVQPLPLPISGSTQVCAGSSVTLTNGTPGGTWTAGPTGVASISSTGVITGSTAGTTVVSYTLGTGCRSTQLFTVNPVPSAIGGVSPVCQGSTIVLTNTLPGGLWATSSTGLLSVDPLTGAVTGLATGVAIVTYAMPTGCTATASILVNPVPAPVAGASAACVGNSTTFTNATAGGTWLSSAPGIAAVGGGSGLVTAISAGVASISYVLPTGCAASKMFTANALPPTITGSGIGCVGNVTTLANATPGGVWTSGSPSVATVDPVTGVVTGVTTGLANVTYTLPTGCATSTVITIVSPPAPVSGPSALCQGLSAGFSSSSTGGTWTTSNTSILTINATTGGATAVGAGVAIVSYVHYTGCYSTHTVTVNPQLPITGTNVVCAGDTITLYNGVAGGVWGSSTVGVATVSPTGRVYGVTSGVAIISYLQSSGCLSIRPVTVNALPSTFLVTGGGSFCIGSPGVPVGLSSSLPGVEYQLYNGMSPVLTIAGTGGALNFGTYTTGGTYSVRAVTTGLGCATMMVGSAVVAPVTLGPAGVSISTTTGDTVCNGTAVTYTPVPYLGGSAPAYQWYVNGTLVSGASSYAYTPAPGDIVTCKLTSSASCAVPATATTDLTMVVLPMVTPGITTSVLPNDTVCAGTAVSFIGTYVNGGSMRQLQWIKNSAAADTGTTYSYLPADGDLVLCRLVSTARCRTADTVYSPTIRMTVLPYATPQVTINADPGLALTPGQEVKFTAVVATAGTDPAYQWSVNSINIPGATTTEYITSSLANGDSVGCTVTSGAPCGGISIGKGVTVVVSNVGVAQTEAIGKLSLMPNPNNGAFVLQGTVPVGADIRLRIFNMIGQQVFYRTATVQNGMLNEHIDLSTELSNGMYTLSANVNGVEQVWHFVVKR